MIKANQKEVQKENASKNKNNDITMKPAVVAIIIGTITWAEYTLISSLTFDNNVAELFCI